MGNELTEYLEFDIEDDSLILDLIRGAEPIVLYVDHQGIIKYLKDWNEEYCQAHGLCPECRTQLIETFVPVPYGDTIVQESEGLSCPVCG